MLNEALIPPKDYIEYWEAQVLLVRILQSSGLRVSIKDRLPLFRLWLIVSKRMTGSRAYRVLTLLQELVNMRREGMEPPFEGGKYL